MAKRKSIGKKLRFEVFKRDAFKCQYCGAAAPDVLLQVDHIQPVSKGGDGGILNLITSCEACNSGKSDRELSDDTAVSKQRAQIEALSERREQLEMLLNWKKGLSTIKEDAVNGIAEAWSVATRHQFHLNETGMQDIRKWLKTFTADQLLEAIDTAAAQYFKVDSKGRITSESVNLALSKVPGIARCNSKDDGMRDLYYIRGIIRNRVSYVNNEVAIDLLRQAHASGAEIDELKAIARRVSSWTQFQVALQEIIDG